MPDLRVACAKPYAERHSTGGQEWQKFRKPGAQRVDVNFSVDVNYLMRHVETAWIRIRIAMDKSARGLDQFLQYLGNKGLMPASTVAARRASCSKMLAILSDDEKMDVTLLDVDEVARRFQNLEGQSYTPDSLKTYKSRFATALVDFQKYLQSPSGFKVKPGATRRASSTREIVADDSKGDSVNPVNEAPTINNEQVDRKHTSGLTLPIPVREGLVVSVGNVPFDLTKAEAKKIANVILALAIDLE